MTKTVIERATSLRLTRGYVQLVWLLNQMVCALESSTSYHR